MLLKNRPQGRPRIASEDKPQVLIYLKPPYFTGQGVSLVGYNFDLHTFAIVLKDKPTVVNLVRDVSPLTASQLDLSRDPLGFFRKTMVSRYEITLGDITTGAVVPHLLGNRSVKFEVIPCL